MTIHKKNTVNEEEEKVEITIIQVDSHQQQSSENITESESSIKSPETKEENNIIYLRANAVSTIDLLYDWNDSLNYRNLFNTINEFYDCFEENSEQKEAWRDSINTTKDKAFSIFKHIEQYIKGAEILMHNDQLLKNIFAEELANLKPLDMIPTMVDDKEAANNFDAHLDALKINIDKGTKVTYKMLVELQNQLELLQQKIMEGKSETDDESLQHTKLDFSEEIERLKQREEKSIELMIQAVDLLDLISNAAKQANLNETWINQIDEATKNYLNELKGMGIEEIEVKGKLLDGNYMISIGTVPLESVEGYEKFQVYHVHERGFKNTNTGKIIREAKVINVY